jgi:hypothetical protein
MSKEIRMTWGEFEDKYGLIKNEHGSMYFDFDDPQVKKNQDKHGDNAYHYVWTQCYEGSQEYICQGYAFVNRSSYLIGTVPWDKDIDDMDYLNITDLNYNEENA